MLGVPQKDQEVKGSYFEVLYTFFIANLAIVSKVVIFVRLYYFSCIFPGLAEHWSEKVIFVLD